jgi:hypothetical protein
VSEVDMQKTGFVQIPVMNFLEMNKAIDEYVKLLAKVDREERDIEQFLEDFVRIRFNRDSLSRGETAHIDIRDIPLYRILGLDKKLKRILAENPEVQLNNVVLYVTTKYDDTMEFVEEVKRK